ncbi:helix-turn-helix domain-containing protein [Sungkyunkwania multivorans]|uniref:Helix-turn-helix domain-containing protein n=1 Tax=Sungkyunkwania multivorans TaxID=1173618 RepID=A0ABW3CZP8_9FLAO
MALILKNIKNTGLSLLLFNGLIGASYSQLSNETLNDSLRSQRKMDSLILLSTNEFKAGDLEAFKFHTEEILTIAEKHNWIVPKIKGLTNLGIYYRQKGEYEKSLKNYLTANTLSESLNNDYKNQAIIHINLANLYLNLEENKKSLASFEKAMTIVDSANGPINMKLSIVNGYGMAYLANDEYENAILKFEYVRSLSRENAMMYEEHVALCNLSEVYAEQEKYHKALEYADEALQKPKEQVPSQQYVSGYLRKSYALMGLETYDLALANLDSAQSIARGNQLFRTEILINQYKAEIFRRLENYEEALGYQKNYLQLKEELTSQMNRAQKVQFDQELAQKEALLSHQNISLVKLAKRNQKKTTYILLLSGLTAALLVFILVRKYRKKGVSEVINMRKKIEEADQDPSIAADEPDLKSEHKPSNGPRIAEQERTVISEQIESFMRLKKPFLNPELKQSDLAKELDLTLHQLSEVLNQNFKENFNAFVNRYRVEEVKRLIKDSKNSNTKIVAIGYEAGFKSKTSLYRAFKLLEKKTPAEYRDTLSF